MRIQYRHPSLGPTTVELAGFSDDDFSTRVISASGTFYEQDLLEYLDWLARRLGLHGVYVDVGSNIGNHAVFFGKFLAEHVVSVEANPAVLPVLERNLRANLQSYTLLACAAGEREGSGTVRFPEENVGMARLEAGDGPAAGSPRVPVRPLDALLPPVLAERPGVALSVIKVDVEGMEAAVLRGATETLRLHRPHLFLEAIDAADRAELDRLLLPLGYRAIARWGHTPMYHYAPSPSLSLVAAAAGYAARARLRAAGARLLRGAARLLPGR